MNSLIFILKKKKKKKNKYKIYFLYRFILDGNRKCLQYIKIPNQNV